MRTGGEVMGSPAAVALPPTDPGEQASVSVPFVAPLVAGSYTSTWQPADADGHALWRPGLGDRLCGGADDLPA